MNATIDPRLLLAAAILGAVLAVVAYATVPGHGAGVLVGPLSIWF